MLSNALKVIVSIGLVTASLPALAGDPITIKQIAEFFIINVWML